MKLCALGADGEVLLKAGLPVHVSPPEVRLRPCLVLEVGHLVFGKRWGSTRSRLPGVREAQGMIVPVPLAATVLGYKAAPHKPLAAALCVRFRAGADQGQASCCLLLRLCPAQASTQGLVRELVQLGQTEGARVLCPVPFVKAPLVEPSVVPRFLAALEQVKAERRPRPCCVPRRQAHGRRRCFVKGAWNS